MRLKAFLGIFYLVSAISAGRAETNKAAWSVLTDAALQAQNPDHRRQAVAAIAAIGADPQAVQTLVQVLQTDKDPMVRQAAASALGEMKAVDAAPALKNALNEQADEVAFAAAKALWDMGDPSGKDTFVEILTRERKDSQGLMGSKMSEAKRTMRDPKKLAYLGAKEASGAFLGPASMGISIVHDAMKDGGASGRAIAADYMSKDCDARSIQLLEWSLKEDGNWLVKAAAARGLGKCGDTQAIPMLETYLDNSHEPLKYQAAAAIVRLSARGETAAASR